MRYSEAKHYQFFYAAFRSFSAEIMKSCLMFTKVCVKDSIIYENLKISLT